MSESYRPGVALITGASGFIGGRLRDALLDDGHDVVALTRRGSPAPRRGRSAGVDYADLDALEQVIERERPEYVFHVAGATKGVSFDEYQQANVMPTRNLLQATRRKHPGLRRFVHISSLAAFGPAADPSSPTREHHERKPVEFYGKSKLEAELAVEGMGDSLPWTIIRPPAVYGPGDVDLFNLFKLANQRLNVFFGNRHRAQSWIYVDDLITGIRNAAAHSETRGKGYFLCDGNPLTWGEYQQHIAAATGKRVFDIDVPEVCLDVAGAFGELVSKFDKKPRLMNRQKAVLGKQLWVCSHETARADFGYRPTVDSVEGIQRTLDWYRQRQWL
jgi:nucleoside-diphosphate-sugar epimerase